MTISLRLLTLSILCLLIHCTPPGDYQFDQLFGAPLDSPLSSLSASLRTFLFREQAPVYPGSVVIKLENDNTYACPFPYTYYSYEDAMNNRIENCCEFKAKATYRILSGGSVSGCDKYCHIQPQDTQVLKKAVCVKSYIKDKQSVKRYEGKCPSGTARMSYAEALLNKTLISTGPFDKARVGFLGSVSAHRYVSEIEEYNRHVLNSSMCVNRTITDLKIVASGEDVCGEGKTLLTPAEAYARINSLCQLIEPFGTARLSGGGSMDGPGYGCAIRDTDRRILSSALCGDIRLETSGSKLMKKRSKLTSWLSGWSNR